MSGKRAIASSSARMQRAVLRRRAADLARLHASRSDDDGLLVD
jgi:hypothetical protein